GTDRQRAVGEARTACLAADRAEVSTEVTAGASAWRSALANVARTIRGECLDGSPSAACPETLGRALQPRPPPHDARPRSARPSGGQTHRDAEVLPSHRGLRLSA